MQYSVSVSISKLKSGDTLAQDREDRGVLIASKGDKINQGLLDSINSLDSVNSVSIYSSSRIINDDYVHLSNDIKERTLDGMAYIYNNLNSKDAISEAKHISGILVSSINNNHGVGLNLDALKVSDDYTFKHSVDVATMGVIVGKEMGFTDQQLLDIATSGILHDIGKVKIPDEILNKPGKLTQEEFSIIKNHSNFGYEILDSSTNISEGTKLGVLQHHEKYNGMGYPNGLKGKQISIIGRLLGIVDVYDALVTKRPYRNGLIEPEQALDIMMEMHLSFDPDVLEHFLSCLIVYPTGSDVILTDNRLYRISKQNRGCPLRPVVMDLKTGQEYDLTSTTQCAGLSIKERVYN